MALSSIVLATGTAATMHVLGMPNPLLWGVIAFVLNFIPYAGPATTLTLLTVVALVSFDGLGKALAVAGGFLVLTGLEGQIFQPVPGGPAPQGQSAGGVAEPVVRRVAVGYRGRGVGRSGPGHHQAAAHFFAISPG